MKILLTGATGYIGRRLLSVLVRHGHRVVALVRNPDRLRLTPEEAEAVEIYRGDLLRPETLQRMPRDIQAAYYLVHSMHQHAGNFMALELDAARNFLDMLEPTACEQIIYLGGMTTAEESSLHLRSRMAVEEVLHASRFSVTSLRAGIIVGSGSASFEIMRDLVEKLPVMVAPRWLNTPHQPIAIRDVLYYLSEVLLHPACYDRRFDIGGTDVLTYREMLLTVARVRGLKRLILTVPVLTPRLSSYWLYLVTQVNFSLARSLVASMKYPVLVKDSSIQEVLPHTCLTFEEAVRRAFSVIEGGEVLSSWRDAWSSGTLSVDAMRQLRVPTYGCMVDERRVLSRADRDVVLDRIWRLGGAQGWYAHNRLWALRGMLDKLVGGVGLRRGRRHPTDLRVGDALDFWRVLVADRQAGRLLLFAEMKLPGEAWLEFRVEEQPEGGCVLFQKAVFRPRGLLGRLYWYTLLPFHHLIFGRMARRLAAAPQVEATS